MSAHHDVPKKAAQAAKETIKQGGKSILPFIKNAGGELLAEIAGLFGYHGIQTLIKKAKGEKTDDHGPEHKPASSGSLEVEKGGKGQGDEQGLMQDIAALHDRMGVSVAEAEGLAKWLQSKHKKTREDFRVGYFCETDASKRLRFLVRWAKMTDAQRNAISGAVGRDEPKNPIKEDIKKIEKWAETELPKINRKLFNKRNDMRNNNLNKISRFLKMR